MNIPDVNVLIYTINEESYCHLECKSWLEKQFETQNKIGLPWIVILEFIRITTNAKIFPRPLAIKDALSIVDNWLEQPNVIILIEQLDHWDVFKTMTSYFGSGGNYISDLHLAALAISHNANLISTDLDFARIPNLKWINPAKGLKTRFKSTKGTRKN